jgi:hypothetical protein
MFDVSRIGQDYQCGLDYAQPRWNQGLSDFNALILSNKKLMLANYLEGAPRQPFVCAAKTGTDHEHPSIHFAAYIHHRIFRA